VLSTHHGGNKCDGWSSLRFKSSFVIPFSNRIFGRHSVPVLTANMARNWFRDDNFTFLIVFFGQTSVKVSADGKKPRPSRQRKQSPSCRHGEISLHLAEGEIECRTAGSSRAPLKKSRATMIGMVKFRNDKTQLFRMLFRPSARFR
jgi:hypothetical protein